jgi:hypothetical protein
MDLQANWSLIKSVAQAAIKSSRHAVIASRRQDGRIHLAPIGHIFLRDQPSLFYFDEYARVLSANIDLDPKITILFVNSASSFWMKFLIAGRFSEPPGVRLYGVAGPRRQATSEEMGHLASRLQGVRGTKGSIALWNHLSYVRDITVDDFEPIRYPKATDGLWSKHPT